jgi:DNA-directed RNA polymerase specialized sigma24 family protein
MQGLTFDEIASRMKIARQAIDSHHQKAIKILKQCFAEDKLDRSILGV